MAAAVAQPRPASSPAGAAAMREVWELAEPPNFTRGGEATAAARAADLASAALARAPPPPPLPDPVARRRVNANIHLSLTTEFATLVGEAPTSFPCPS